MSRRLLCTAVVTSLCCAVPVSAQLDDFYLQSIRAAKGRGQTAIEFRTIVGGARSTSLVEQLPTSDILVLREHRRDVRTTAGTNGLWHTFAVEGVLRSPQRTPAPVWCEGDRYDGEVSGGLIAIRFPGGETTIEGVTVRDTNDWAFDAVETPRYIVFVQFYSATTGTVMAIRGGWFGLADDGRIVVHNPFADAEKEMHSLGSLTKFQEWLTTQP